MSSIAGTVENNVIKLPEGLRLPDGTPVRVETLTEPGRNSFAERYATFIGAVDDAPADLAENHDHYLYAARKHSP
jgi:hypothetical protein